MARVELRHLRYFVAVAEERSFTRAAERLHMQQPPLSQQVQALERQLGVRLFERLPRGVELTAGGRAFLEDAREMLASLEGAAARARRVSHGVEGALTLGIASSAATHPIVPTLIAGYQREHPGVFLSFVEGNAASLTEALVAGTANLALLRSPVDRRAEVRFHRLLQEPMLAAISKSHPLAATCASRSPPWITLRELARSPFILVRRPGAPGMYADLLAACEDAGIAARIACEVGNMLTNVVLVAAGAGVSVVPASMRGIQSDMVSYVPLRGAGRLVAPLTLLSRVEESNPAVPSFLARARALARTPA